MKKTALFASALLIAAACNTFRTQIYEDDLVMPLADGQEDSLFYATSLEYATGGMLIPAMEKMNRAIVQQAFDLEGVEEGTLEEVASAYRENLIDEYITENGTPEEEMGVLTWEDKINGVFTTTYKNWRNYTLSYYNFRGGAHGIQTVSQLVFDKKTGEQLEEAQLFADGYAQPVALLMQAAVKADMEAEDPELVQLVEMDSVVPNGNFSVGTSGVQWIFQPYEVGPYALGIVTALVSWEELKPYLK
jgi:hypothetical protein